MVAAPQAAGGGFGRKKRQVVGAGLLKPTVESIAKFDETNAKVKAGMATKVGNLTCVLAKMNLLDGAGNVNMKHFTEEMWARIGPNGAAKDPAFVQKMKDGFTECYSVAQAWPQSSLDKSPITKAWGRQMVFFKCAHKVEKKTCAQAQVKDMLELKYGPINPARFPEFNGDLYEAATYALKVKQAMTFPEEEMVHQFMMGSMAE